VIGILVSDRFPADVARRMEGAANAAGRSIRWIHLPPDPEARLDPEQVAAIEVAVYSADIFENRGRSFFSAVRKAARLRWLQTFSAGVDHPVFGELQQRGVRLTTAAGVAAVPIAQTAIAGLLMLARGFPHWLAAQRRHHWQPRRGADQPADLAGQTLCVVGLGSIGTEIARLGAALGLEVIGIRRSARRADDPVAEIHPPAALPTVLPRCAWLALACPLTGETRGMIDATAIDRLPRGAQLLNVARGEIVDEPAMLAALRSGHLAGAYLDVFATEPLAAESPLWDLPNVIVTPHNSSAARGNERRQLELFARNFSQWVQGRPLHNEV
jgi:phosphoglycerate dehydrogenase-like enzyme